MSQRGKRQASRLDDGPVATKRRKARSLAQAEEEEASVEVWTPRPNADLKISAIYNRSAAEAPAEVNTFATSSNTSVDELFRKDLISAMKLPDSEPLSADEYWIITDQWKQEWEKGVQVPVNPDSLPAPSVTVVTQAYSSARCHNDFKLPKNKYVRITKDDDFKPDDHFLSPIPTKGEKVCSYDLDNCDIAWLRILNGERAQMGYHPLREDQLERVIEELELRSWEKVQTIIKSEEGLGIEFDENVICDVCRSPDSEEGNEMVFCDSCNICVHQACYGITAIPSGSWLCRTCSQGQRPECVLCPNKGGAMKCTRSGQKWAHVSCALWIPEVSIGCVEKMEPITKISSIPQSRWALICVLCRERVGACIQCSVKTCKVAYHVTCAFKHGLEMKAIIEDENADDGVKLRSYCEKHSMTPKKDRCGSVSEEDDGKRKKRKDMTSEEKSQARAAKLLEIESEFEKHVSANDISGHHDVDQDGLVSIYHYWVLKRRSGGNKPLIAPRPNDVDFLTRQQEQADMERMRLFVQIRQDLERVRNLCYMVSRREKLSRTFFRMREQTFHKQIAVLSNPQSSLSSAEITAIREANHGPSIYDRLYSHATAPELSTDFETTLARIAGVSSPTPEEKIKVDRNGMRRKPENPYKRMYLNGGLERRRSIYTSMSSGSELDVKKRVSDSSDSKKAAAKSKRLKKRVVSRMNVVDTSTEDEDLKPKGSWTSPRSRTLQQMEKELDKTGSDDSDDLISFSNIQKENSRSALNIYSDSDTDSSLKGGRSSSKNVRTKAAVKEFTGGKNKKSQPPPSSKTPSKNKHVNSFIEDDFYRDKENLNTTKRKPKESPNDLIVPQRQAAKKATESIRSAQVKKNDQVLAEQEAVKTMSPNDENRIKSKSSKVRGGKDVEHKRSGNKEDRSKSSNDVYEFDKDMDQDILAYVPQRQAAKIAAEHIKSGLHKLPSGGIDGLEQGESKCSKVPESPAKKREEVKVKKEPTPVEEKTKKLVKPVEVKGRKTPKFSVSSSSSSSSSSTSSGSTSTTTSTSSESEDDEKKPSAVDKKSLFDSPVKEEKKQTRASVALQEKKPISRKLESSSSGSSILDKSKLSIQSSSSSSSDSDDSKPSRSSLTKETQASTPTPPPQQAVAKRSRKSPEKKLKTSDGRPELDLQQPPSKREESSPSTKRGRGKSGETVPAAPTVHSKSEPQVKESNSSCVKRHSKAPSVSPKKEPQPSQGRKRKPDDLEKKSSPAQRSSSPHVARAVEVKRSPCAPVVAAAAPISTPTQHSPAPSRKVDSKKISDSPGKQRTPESQSIASMLEREMAERKAGRDVGNRKSNSSKKSLNRLFEKRDELVMKEKERKDKEVKPSEKSVQKSPDKCNKEKPVAAPVKDENRNDKIEPKWLSFNNADRLREEEKKPQSKRSLFSPVPDSEPQPELLESAANNNQKSSADMNVKNEPGSLPVLSPPPLLQPLSGPLDKCDLSQMDTLLDSKVSRTPSLSVLSGLSSRVLSPQPSKDSSIELFDLENDILDHSHNDSFTDLRNCGQLFPFQRSLMGMPPSKEDSDRETMNLVEKLREQYAKKTHEPASQEPDDDEPLEARPPFQPSPTPSQVPDIPTSNPCTLPVDAKLESILNQEEPQLIAPSIPDEIKLAAVENKAILNAVEETALRMGVTEQQADKQSEYEPSPSVDHFQYPPYSLSLDVGKVPGREKLDRSNSAQADERWVPPSIGIAAPPSVYESVSSPYRNKWAESEIMPSRHSSSSSASSTSSSSQREDIELAGSQGKHEDLPIQPPVPTPLELLSFHHPAGPMQFNPGCPLTNPLPGPPSFHFGDPSVQFPVHPPTMSLFQAPPFSSANPPPLFPPSFPPSFATPQLKVPQDDLPPVSAPPTPGSMQMPQPPPLSLSQPLQPPPAACSAAFTASSHNMAITAAMVSPMVPPSNTQEPSLVPLPFPPDNCQQMPKSEPSVQPQPTPIQPKVEPPTVQPAQQPQEATRPPTPTPPQVQQQPPTPTPPPKTTPQPSVTIQQPPSVPPSSVSSTEGPPTPKPSPASLPQGKKSPSKPTRASARFIAQQKSPAKSPGKSPRQLADLKKVKDGGTGTKRGRPSGSRGTSRGRGRGRGRGGRVGGALGDTASKLAGTVYDFDFDDEEDGGGDSLEHLRAMRERRKSSDVHEKLSGNTPKDSPQSPKFTSPAQHRSNKSTPSAVFPSPVDNNRGRSSDVQPMLPGPVDMRTYSSFNTSVNTASFHNHLMEPLPQDRLDTDKDYVAELEEEIKTLKSSTVPKVQETPPPATLAPPLPAPSAPSSAPAPEEPKSPHHTDSRNQLKVKIKGPFLDANYMASSVVPQASVVPVSSNHPPEPPVTPVVNSTSGTTSNLRRMRKKELLRQYWNQDMNMDETTVPIVPPPALPVPDPVPSSRNVITIPKAVASMPNIPTREDYKAVVDANMEKKRRKEKSAYDLDLGDHWRPSASAAAAEPPTQAPPPVKRGRGRAAKTKPVTPPPSSTPKLKIKLGDTASVTTMSEDKKNLRVRPPKKRITAPAPTVEEMKRESMKFRNMVMADFDEEEKVVEVVSKKRKKKNAQPTDKTTGKGEPTPSVRVITDDAKPKLIIRFGKPAAPAEPTIEQSHSPTDGDRTSECSALRKVRTSKTVPIRLKLSRCEEGYVMKPSSDSVNASEERNGNGSVPSSSKAPAPSGKSAETLPPAPPPKPNPTDAQPPPEPPPPTLPLSKDCEVR